MLGLFIALPLFVFSVFRIFIIETLITRVIIIFQALGNFLQASKMTDYVLLPISTPIHF